MARRPRARVDVFLSWMRKGILPNVTRQPVPDHCGAQVALESFESRCRILDLAFPTLSIQHLIDLQRDAKANAATLAEKTKVYDEEYVFELLKNNGVTTKQDYDSAPPVHGQYTKDVQGLKHYKILEHQVWYLQESPLRPGYDTAKKMRQAIDEIANNGPVYSWFVVDTTSFSDSKHEIYRHPRPLPKVDGGRLPTHAVLVIGFGARGRRTRVFAYQNSWGPGHHVGGRGLMESKGIIGVIVPKVVRNWD